MAWRYRKSVQIAPGIKVNFSKSGVSTTLGGKGFSVSTSSRGTYVNRSIPGTGLYSRQKIGGRSSKKSTKKSSAKVHSSGSRSTKNSSPASSSSRTSAETEAIQEYCRLTGEPSMHVSLSIDSTGNIKFFDRDERPITDAHLIELIKKTSMYKESVQKLKYMHELDVAQQVEESRAESEAYTTLHKQASEVWTPNDYQEALDELELECYEPTPFVEPMPVESDVEQELMEEAEHEVKTYAFWRAQSLKDQYVQERLKDRYDQRLEEWRTCKQVFDEHESEEAARKNAQYQKEYEQDLEVLTNALEGVSEYVEDAAEEWLGQCDLPVALSASFEYRPNEGDFLLDLDLPEIEDLPQETAEQLKSGNLKVKQKTQTALRAEYAQCVFGAAIYVASNIFNISPQIKRVLVSGYTQRRDKIGELVDDYIYSIWFTREGFYGADYEVMDPEAFCMNFENRCNVTKTKIFKTIVPYEG